MSKIEQMIADKDGNIYISLEEYQKDFDRVKKGLKEARKNLLHTKNAMTKMYRKFGDTFEGIKALGYVESIDYLQKYILEIIGETDERKTADDN